MRRFESGRRAARRTTRVDSAAQPDLESQIDSRRDPNPFRGLTFGTFRMPPSARSGAPPAAPADDNRRADAGRPDEGRDESSGRRWVLWLETWSLSLIFHTVLFVVLGLTWTAASKPAGDSAEPLRTVELVVRRETSEGPKHLDQQQVEAAQAAQAKAAAAPGPPSTETLLGQKGAVQSPVDFSAALPKASDVAGFGVGASPTLPGGAGLLDNPGEKTSPTAGRGRTSVYGLHGEGFKFVYIFDRSGSMGGTGNRALNAAKAELLRSLAELGDTHQFQIIFYNEQPIIMQLAQSSSLMLATKQNKDEARRFVNSISADGATAHEPAILLGLRLSPDVIFFLTDADQPELSPGQLDRIKKLNNGRAVINTIEFGLGPKVRKHNFLDALAEQNGGRSAYLDISR
jgi:hypothetical protein